MLFANTKFKGTCITVVNMAHGMSGWDILYVKESHNELIRRFFHKFISVIHEYFMVTITFTAKSK